MAKSSKKKQVVGKGKRSAKPVKTKSLKASGLGRYKYTSLAVFAVIVLTTLALRIPLLDLPLDRDEGTYMYLGNMITEGGTIYVDGTEMKPPGIFLSYALVDIIFGDDTRDMHLALLFITILSSWFIYLIGSRWTNPIAGLITALGYILLSVHPHLQGQALVSEPIMNLSFLGGMVLLTPKKQKPNLWLYVAAGALMGWSLLIKQNGIFHILIGGLYLLFHNFPKQALFNKDRWSHILFYTMGTIGVVAICMLYVIMSGAWSDFIYWNYTYPQSQYLSSFTFSDGIPFLKGIWSRIVAFNGLLWYLGMAGLIVHVALRIRRGRSYIVLLWLILSAIMILPGYRFYGHYWHFVIPIIAMGMGFLVYHFQELLLGRVPRGLLMVVPLALLAIYLIDHLPKHAWYYKNEDDLIFSRTVYGLNPFYEMEELSAYLNKRMTETDRLMVFGSETQFYLQTDKEMLHPTTYFTFLVKNHERGYELRQELKEALQADPPEYVVHVQHPYSWSITENDDQTLYQWAYGFGKNNYDAIAYADIIAGQPPVFLYDADAKNYQPRSNQYVVVYKRRF